MVSLLLNSVYHETDTQEIFFQEAKGWETGKLPVHTKLKKILQNMSLTAISLFCQILIFSLMSLMRKHRHLGCHDTDIFCQNLAVLSQPFLMNYLAWVTMELSLQFFYLDLGRYLK